MGAHDKRVADVNAGNFKPSDLKLLAEDAIYCGLKYFGGRIDEPLVEEETHDIFDLSRERYPSALYAHPEGFMMYLCDDEGMLTLLPTVKEGYSEEFVAMVRALRAQGYEWVWIDRDGWGLPGAPEYDPNGKEIKP